MAHAQGGSSGTTPPTIGKSWNAALGQALQETDLDPNWADVRIEHSKITALPVPSDLPDKPIDSHTVAVPKKPHARASVKPVIPALNKAPLRAAALLHKERAEDEAFFSTNTENELILPLKAATDPTPLPINSTTLKLVPGKGRLASSLMEFARANGWEIAWEIERDFPVDYPATFHGPFLDIITSVVASLHTTDAPIRAKIYHGNKVVRIIHATR